MDKLLLSKGYQLGETIGEGTYSKVKEAYSRNLQRKVAIKIIDRRTAPKDFIHKFLPRELQIVQVLDHQNIVKVHEVWESEDGRIGMVMELAEGGDILEHIRREGPLSELLARPLFRQLVNAIRYCHDRGIAHRDLKCENTLLDKSFNVKLADFGFATHFGGGAAELSQTFCGSTAYAAPEVLQGVPHQSSKSDVWSLGIVLYIVLCGHLPFDDSNIPKMLWLQQNGVAFPQQRQLSREVRDLVGRLLEPDCSLRPLISHVCSHPWLAEPQ
ncbi:testis-specific serine/threonine-protein kinase 3 [Amblyraja radiata]|uniref:testis-specific serine/threonine-protein kinase 3 n=1 Tax=Amblyraja radiata TaxID=386614 RepID=UPI00140228C2|nr:testis-specific serine/threonine-protein kinase 3 [Amblyraja radiata]XP_055512651.1 testis-specific serine/threonine-protein kinase 3-like [Leucoraja erinacea]